MFSPLISVIIPTYNRSHYLPCAVESVLGQVGVEVEVLVVDDGSTDDTAKIVEGLAPRWGERVRYFWQENAERSIARNNGLRHASGEFIAFLDSDDVWCPHHAQACLALLSTHPDAIAAYGEYGQITADGHSIRAWVRGPQSTGDGFFRDLYLKRLILQPTRVVLRRSALGTTDIFDPEIPGAEDWLLWVSLSRHGAFYPVGRATVWMRVHPNTTFGNPAAFTRSLMRAAEKVIATGLPQSVGIQARQIIAINRTHCAYAYYLSGNWVEALGFLNGALRGYPAIVCEPDFWQVVVRLCIGKKLSRFIRAVRQQGRGELVGIARPQLIP